VRRHRRFRCRRVIKAGLLIMFPVGSQKRADEQSLREAVRSKVLKRHCEDRSAVVFDELGLRHGLAIIDIVVVTRIIHGYELKSDLDSLVRLPAQMEIYNSVLDKVTLVVGYRHLSAARDLLPAWWGLIAMSCGPRGGWKVVVERRARLNHEVNLLSLVKLLWRDEALLFLESLGAAAGVRSKPRDDIYRRIVEVAGPDVIRDRVCWQLKSRNWRQKKYP